MNTRFTISQKDQREKLSRVLQTLVKSEVLVGIPESDAPRQENEGVTNAELAYIHTFGSPLKHIPARPFLEPSISDPANRELIVRPLEAAAKAALDGNTSELAKDLQVAGATAANAVKRWFTNPANHWAPNAPSTIRRKGSDRPLIDTAQLRRSVTYVVKDK